MTAIHQGRKRRRRNTPRPHSTRLHPKGTALGSGPAQQAALLATCPPGWGGGVHQSRGGHVSSSLRLQAVVSPPGPLPPCRLGREGASMCGPEPGTQSPGHPTWAPWSCLPCCGALDKQWDLSETAGSPPEVSRYVLQAGQTPGKYSASRRRTGHHLALCTSIRGAVPTVTPCPSHHHLLTFPNSATLGPWPGQAGSSLSRLGSVTAQHPVQVPPTTLQRSRSYRPPGQGRASGGKVKAWGLLSPEAMAPSSKPQELLLLQDRPIPMRKGDIRTLVTSCQGGQARWQVGPGSLGFDGALGSA